MKNSLDAQTKVTVELQAQLGSMGQANADSTELGEKLRDLEQAEEALKAENQKLSRQMADKLDQAAEEAQA